MNNSFIQSIMNMSVDLYEQKNTQAAGTGVITREWVYNRTINCRVEPLKTKGSSNKADNKTFSGVKFDEYDEKLQLKMKCMMPISKRWRVSGIRTNDGRQVYTEIDLIDNPDTKFDVTASHAVLDPFGKISYYDVTLQRVHIQSDNTTSK